MAIPITSLSPPLTSTTSHSMGGEETNKKSQQNQK
jgi:hypothetical protein